MRSLRIVELVVGWFSVILGVALLSFIYKGGFIAPESVGQDLIGFSVILLILAVGVTLDVFFSSLATVILIGVGALAMTAVAVVSFIILALLPAALALTAAVIAFARYSLKSLSRA